MADPYQHLVGKRVRIHPACDYWMRGATEGTVVEVKSGLAKAKVRLSNFNGDITDGDGKPLSPVWIAFANLMASRGEDAWS